MALKFKLEFNKILGYCYAAEEESFPAVLDKVVQFLETEAPRDLKIKCVFALIQAAIENGILNSTAVDSIQKLPQPKYRDILLVVLNQTSFIDFFIKNAPYPEGYASIFVPEIDQLFSDSTVLYALSHENIRSNFTALFSCHPVILKDVELQRNAFKSFVDVTNVFSYSEAVYITDEVIDSFSAEDQFFIFRCMSFHERVKRISFSPEKIKNTAYLYLIAGDEIEKQKAKDCLKYLEKVAVEYVSEVDPIEFDLDPNKYKTISIDELVNVDSVLAAIELLHPYNIGRLLRLLSLFLNKHPKKKDRRRIYFKFRNKLISVMKKNPWQVASALYFSKETDAALKLFNDSSFRKVVETIRNRPNVHDNFTFYMREIDYYLEQRLRPGRVKPDLRPHCP